MGQSSSQPKPSSPSQNDVKTPTHICLYDFFHNKVFESRIFMIEKVEKTPSPLPDLYDVKITYRHGKKEIFHNIKVVDTY